MQPDTLSCGLFWPDYQPSRREEFDFLARIMDEVREVSGKKLAYMDKVDTNLLREIKRPRDNTEVRISVLSFDSPSVPPSAPVGAFEVLLHRRSFKPMKSMAKVMAYFNARNLYAVPTEFDGNCLFRAVADQLFYSGGQPCRLDRHLEIRDKAYALLLADDKKLVEYWNDAYPVNAPAGLQAGLDGWVDLAVRQRMDDLCKPGHPVGNEMIWAIAKLYDVFVYVHWPEMGRVIRLRPSNEAVDFGKSIQIHLNFTNGNHLESIRYLPEKGQVCGFLKSTRPRFVEDSTIEGRWQADTDVFVDTTPEWTRPLYLDLNVLATDAFDTEFEKVFASALLSQPAEGGTEVNSQLERTRVELERVAGGIRRGDVALAVRLESRW
ncbi:MAG: hypothetical protein M3Y27_05755, partial [Acidobacteriota bacterium]|nr:hypothetical protein [Acidobacteriota bacterium]